jgi:uncharacterized membrane protein YfcA
VKLLKVLVPSVAIGLVAGTMSGLFGVGGGVVMVPLLVMAFGADQHLAQGTSLAAMIPVAVAGVLRYAAKGHVDWTSALGLAVGGIAGAYLVGAPAAQALKAVSLQRLFGVLMIVVGLRMLGVFALIGSALGLGGQTAG